VTACDRPDASAGKGAEQPQSASTERASAFDLNAVPITQAAVPAFPVLTWPRDLASQAPDDRVDTPNATVELVAGVSLYTVSGHALRERRALNATNPETSQPALRAHIAAQVETLGGLKINALNPIDPNIALPNPTLQSAVGPDVDLPKRLDLYGYDEGQFAYDAYVIRAADRAYFAVLQSSQYSAVLTVAEQAQASEK
jgi:hypothetical protein